MHIVYHEIIYFKEKIFKTYFADLDSTLIFNYGDLIGDQESNTFQFFTGGDALFDGEVG